MTSSSSTSADQARAQLAHCTRVVVKVGSALLAQDAAYPKKLAQQLAALQAQGKQCVVVTSGAIALGLTQLGHDTRPTELAALQAAAAVGQVRLMAAWEEAFAAHQQQVAQLLLTHADLSSRRRYLNARAALCTLLDAGVVPVVNENDTVSVAEIRLGDNDTLAAEVAGLASCDLLVLLTGVDGMYDRPPEEPGASRISFVDVVDDDLRNKAGPAAAFGTGGMQTKLAAADIARRHGTATVIAHGEMPDIVQRVVQGDDVGTLFAHDVSPQAARKRWIASLRGTGRVVVDAGARRALEKNSSLLYAGVVSVDGTFEAGDAVDVVDGDGLVFARGLVALPHEEAHRVAGMRSDDARALLGSLPKALIHRDDLVWLEG